MPEKKNNSNKGGSGKKTKPVLVELPVPENEKKSTTQRTIGIGMPIDENTLRELKKNAKKL